MAVNKRYGLVHGSVFYATGTAITNKPRGQVVVINRFVQRLSFSVGNTGHTYRDTGGTAIMFPVVIPVPRIFRPRADIWRGPHFFSRVVPGMVKAWIHAVRVKVEVERRCYLPKLRGGIRHAPLCPRGVERRHHHACEKSDDGDNDEKLDEGEPPPIS